MTRLIWFVIAAAMFSAAPALAHDHGSGHNHSQSHGACCYQISGQTAEVLIAPNSDAIRRIQAELAVNGFDPGPIDGIMGPRTEAALRRFQRREGLYEGLLTTETLSRLGIRLMQSDAAHTSSALRGGVHSSHQTTARTHSHAPTVTRRVVRSSTESSRPIEPAPSATVPLPNYVGPSGEHHVAPLGWPEKADR